MSAWGQREQSKAWKEACRKGDRDGGAGEGCTSRGVRILSQRSLEPWKGEESDGPRGDTALPAESCGSEGLAPTLGRLTKRGPPGWRDLGRQRCGEQRKGWPQETGRRQKGGCQEAMGVGGRPPRVLDTWSSEVPDRGVQQVCLKVLGAEGLGQGSPQGARAGRDLSRPRDLQLGARSGLTCQE